MINKFSILTIALLVGLTMSACASSPENNRANDKAASGTEQVKAPANDKKSDNKASENKIVDEKKEADSTVENIQTETKGFSEAEKAGDDKLSGFPNWKIIYGADQIKIDANGRGKRITSTNVTNETDFNLPVQDNSIDRVLYFTKYKDDWIFLYELTNGEEGSGIIARLDGKTLKPKWNAQLGSFNISNGLLENQFAYLGASGFAGKIDLDSGKYIWKHEDFYRKYKKEGAFNSLEAPKLEGGNVVFNEKLEDSSSNSVIFDKASGKVVKVNVN